MMPRKLVVFVPDDLATWVDGHKHVLDPCKLLEEQFELARIAYDDGWDVGSGVGEQATPEAIRAILDLDDPEDEESRAEAVAGSETFRYYIEHKNVPHPTPWMDALSRAITVLLDRAREHEWPEDSYVRGFREGFIESVRERAQ